jgi:hypothetical protein
MCRTCLDETLADLDVTEVAITTPMTELAALIWDWYQMPGNGAGGPLHIIVDDNNIHDNHLESCRLALTESGVHIEQGNTILDQFAALTLAERAVTVELAHQHDHDRPTIFPAFFRPQTESETGPTGTVYDKQRKRYVAVNLKPGMPAITVTYTFVTMPDELEYPPAIVEWSNLVDALADIATTTGWDTIEIETSDEAGPYEPDDYQENPT